MHTTTVQVSAELECRAFAQVYPTPNTELAVSLCEFWPAELD